MNAKERIGEIRLKYLNAQNPEWSTHEVGLLLDRVERLESALECIAGFSDEISSVRVAEKSLEDGGATNE